MNACRQTGLRGADRREMASTCYIAGASLLSTPQLHDTHTHAYVCVCVPVSSALSLVLCSRRLREGWMSSLLLASPPLIFNPAAYSHKPKHPTFDVSLPRYLFRCSLLFSLHLSSSQLAYAPSSSSLSLSGCLSASASLALLSAQLRDSCPQHFLSLSSARALLSPSLFLSLTPKYQ